MTDSFESLKSALSDRYTIDRELGAGGMATVYLAHDVKHDRKVAVKVLRPELAAVLGTERFLNEIKVTANLSHPHILPLLDSGTAEEPPSAGPPDRPSAFLYYVMPYVDGESLRDKLDREKQLSIEESVKITESVASALDYAHRQNVIHRDIKPENILLHDGQPVVADFGISLAVSAAGGTRLTETGLSLGTPHYMSPEQATGDREIDAKSDIYSLGCVLYEMLAGDPPHTGSTVQAVIAATVSSDPTPITERRRTVPNHIAAALHHALEKIPADRFASAGGFAEALGSKATRAVPSVDVGRPEGSRYLRLAPWLVTAVLTIVLVIQLLSDSPEPEPLIATYIGPPEGHQMLSQGSFAISPDGTQLVFATVSDSGSRQLWLRPLDTLDASVLAPIDGMGWPFWSPDGQYLGYFAEGSVWILNASSREKRPLCDATIFRGGAWNVRDTIVFAAAGGMWRAGAQGNGCELFVADTSDSYTGRPSFLPDGIKFLFTRGFGRTIELGDVRTGETRVLRYSSMSPSGQGKNSWVQFARPDFLVFGGYEEDGTGWEFPLLRAARIDLSDYTILGEPVEIVREVRSSAGIQSYSVSNIGRLVYTPWDRNLPPVALDRDGTLAENQMEYIPGRWVFSVAREHPWLFLSGDNDIWKFDRSTGIPEKLHTGRAYAAVPGPRDSVIVYLHWSPEDNCSIRLLDLSRDSVSVVHTERCLMVTDWSRDGQHLLLENSLSWLADSLPSIEIWQYSFSDSSLSRLVARDGDARDGALSPDGRWIAFSSDETGPPEIYVRRSASRGAAVRISTTGGRWPRWNENGRELYYLSPDGAVYVADLTSVLAGRSPTVPRVLFVHPLGGTVAFADAATGFGATSDGLTFFLRPRTQSHNIALIQNWPALLERR